MIADGFIDEMRKIAVLGDAAAGAALGAGVSMARNKRWLPTLKSVGWGAALGAAVGVGKKLEQRRRRKQEERAWELQQRYLMKGAG